MSFVNPWFLFALSAIAIPIIIHLFKFRRFRKVLFSNVSFLEELKEEKRKQSKLKNLLILLFRILAILFLVLAFTRPYIPHEDGETSHEGNVVSIYVDNSFSMEALADRGRLVDEAKLIAEEISEEFAATDDFHLLTNDFEGKHQRLVNLKDFIGFLEEIEISPVVRELSQIYQRQKEMLNNSASDSKHIFMLSDFQKNVSDFENFEVDTGISAYFIPLDAQRADNLYIDSLWFEQPAKMIDQPVDINVRISNDGDQALENQPLRLYVNDALRSVANFDIQAGEKLEKQLSYTISDTGLQQGWVEIVDHPVVFDDKMFFGFNVTENIPVLTVNQGGENRYLNALFKDEDLFEYRNMSLLDIDYSAFQGADMIIMNGLNTISSGMQMEITRFVEEGGSLVVFPGKDIDLDSYNEFLTSLGVNYFTSLDTTTYRVNSINEQHNIYHGVFDEVPGDADLPVAENHYEVSGRVAATEDYLLQLQNRNSFFASYPYENGTVYLSAVPLDEDFSNFPMHPVFVPTMYNAALHSVPQLKPYYIIGENLPIQIRHQQKTTDPVYKITGDEIEFIPEVRTTHNRINLYTHDQIKEAGNYHLYSEGKLIDGVSFNYDRRESKLEAYDAGELENMITDHQMERISALDVTDISFDKAFEKYTMGRELWQLCLILALLFFLGEILLLRFWER